MARLLDFGALFWLYGILRERSEIPARRGAMLSFNVIVVPTDFSDFSMRALDYALGLAEKYDAKVEVLYVAEQTLQVSDMAWVGVDDRSIKDEHAEEARRQLEQLVAEKVPDDLPAAAEVRTGDAVDEIIGFAEERGADLIVMATHGRTGLSHMLMGSTAERVIRKASCPVLTLKQPMQVPGAPEDRS
jgi:nucleotide-binding universal stress UspA family protein